MAGRRQVRDLQESFAGGLNTSADESQVKRNEIREAENCLLTEHGGVTKRRGTQQTHDESLGQQQVQGGFTWRKSTPATHLVTLGGDLFTAPHGSYPWTFSGHGGGLNPSTLHSFASFRDVGAYVVYIADGGQPHKWKSSGLTLNVAGTPNVSRVAVHNLRLFGVGDPTSPEAVYFSGLGNGDTLGDVANGGGEAIVRTFAHEPLTGLLSVGQSLLMFHERGISRFTGWSQDDFNIDAGTRGITQDVGTIAPNSIVGVENVGFFLSDRGAYAVTESGVQQISMKIENILSALSAPDLRLCSAAHHRAARQVWFAIPGYGILVYDYRLQSWCGPLTGVYLEQTPLLLWESGAGNTPELMIGGVDGFIRQAEVPGLALDNVEADGVGGSRVTMSVRCHRMFFGAPTSEKSLRFLFATANLRGSSGASLGWETGEEAGAEALEETGTTAIWGSVTWLAFSWGVGGSSTKRVHANGRGKYVDLRITDDGLTLPVFSRIEAEAFEMGERY